MLTASEVVKIAVKKRGREKRMMKGRLVAFTSRAIAFRVGERVVAGMKSGSVEVLWRSADRC